MKKNGPLAERTIQSYTYQLLDALTYIHAKNIVHRSVLGYLQLLTVQPFGPRAGVQFAS